MVVIKKFNKTQYKYLHRTLDRFKRDELRRLAKAFSVPIGRNKSDTISNLVKHRFQVHARITMIVDWEGAKYYDD